MSNSPVTIWHEAIEHADLAKLDELLHEDCVFLSPIIFTPQKGRELTKMYLMAAYAMLTPNGFTYTREIVGERDAVLEFTANIDGIEINGVDMMHWDAEGKVTEFKVMIRPLKAVGKIQEKMLALLEQ